MWKFVQILMIVLVFNVHSLQTSLEDIISKMKAGEKQSNSTVKKAQESRACSVLFSNALLEDAKSNRELARSLCQEVKAYILINDQINSFCNEELIQPADALSAMYRYCYEGSFVTIAKIMPQDDTTQNFWDGKCIGIMLTENDIVRIRMGQFVDFYKPAAYPMPLCTFIKSNNMTWSAVIDGTYVKPPPSGDENCWGCIEDWWPKQNGGGDRRQLSLWGSGQYNEADQRGRGGCCHLKNGDTSKWGQPFEMAIGQSGPIFDKLPPSGSPIEVVKPE